MVFRSLLTAVDGERNGFYLFIFCYLDGHIVGLEYASRTSGLPKLTLDTLPSLFV
jgi:hypothetical protein